MASHSPTGPSPAADRPDSRVPPDRVQRVLIETARQLGSSLDPAAIFARLLDSVRALVRCDGLIVSEYDAAAGVIRCVYCWTPGGNVDATSLPPVHYRPDGGGMQSQVIRTGRPARFGDVAERVRDPRGTYYEVESGGRVRDLGAAASPPRARSALMVPLLLEGEVTGVVQVMADAEAAYGDADLELLSNVSLLLAVALENARLFRRGREELEERVHAERVLREAEERYRAFVANSTEGIYRIEFDPPVDTSLPVDDQVRAAYAAGRLAECNDAFARMYGYERGVEMLGFTVDRLLPPDDAAAVAHVRRVIESGYRVVDAESQEVDRHGGTVWLSNNLEGVVEDGGLHRIWGTQRDISDRRRTEQALRDADRRKDEFLATLGHELRNPLNPLRSAVELLKRTAADTAEVRWCAAVMERQVGQLARLIDDLLDVSRITEGRLELRPETVTVRDVLAAAVEAATPALDARRQRLTLSDLAGPAHLVADRVRLAQVFGNLLDNAVKYSPDGAAIDVRIERTPAEVVVTIQDEGIGIAPRDLDRIFDWFYQGDRQADRAPAGLGIGLTLVKRLVELHGGTVRAKSDGPGRGCAFVVRLPARAALDDGRAGDGRASDVVEPRDDDSGREREPESAPRPAAAARPQPESGAARRILVADDNRDSADSMAMLLRLAGQEVATAYDGHEAVRVADELRPHVLVLDLGLPGLDGCEVARELSTREWARDALLIAATGWGQDEDRERTRAAGFAAHLVKPVDSDQLLDIVRRMSLR